MGSPANCATPISRFTSMSGLGKIGALGGGVPYIGFLGVTHVIVGAQMHDRCTKHTVLTCRKCLERRKISK